MAAGTKAQWPVGSAEWIQDENRQITQFCTQETEDFSFSARNEIEWLNEHMAEIFSKNQV
jgi:phage pi2 protein 07